MFITKWIFYQITQNFDEVVALASAPRPDQPRRIFFEDDEFESWKATGLYSDIIENLLQYDDPCFSFIISHLTFSDALHVILAGFQNKPLSLKYFGMKKALELKLDLKDLPRELKVKAVEGSILTCEI